MCFLYYMAEYHHVYEQLFEESLSLQVTFDLSEQESHNAEAIDAGVDSGAGTESRKQKVKYDFKWIY